MLCRKAKLQEVKEGQKVHFNGAIFLFSGQLQLADDGSMASNVSPLDAAAVPSAGTASPLVNIVSPAKPLASTMTGPASPADGSPSPEAASGSADPSDHSDGSHHRIKDSAVPRDTCLLAAASFNMSGVDVLCLQNAQVSSYTCCSMHQTIEQISCDHTQYCSATSTATCTY